MELFSLDMTSRAAILSSLAILRVIRYSPLRFEEMKRDTCATYPPLNTLKPVTQDISIADGPVIRFGMPWLEMPFPTIDPAK